MGAFIKQIGTLIAGNMAGSNNKASFIVKTARTGYVASGAMVALVWYTGWRNERVAPGEISFPIPGMKSLRRAFPPDRPEKEFQHAPKITPSESWGNSLSGGSKSQARQSAAFASPALGALPQTVADARKYRGVVRYEGKLVAAWINAYLLYAKSKGWKGTLTQGFRTYSEEVSIWNSGIRPAARPGSSNHGKKNFPGGAADVTEAAELNKILSEIPGGSLLKWAGSKDEVHFSYPHDGGY